MAGLIDTAGLLGELVALKSVDPSFGGPGEGELASFVADWLRRAGADVALQEVLPGRNNVIAMVRAGSGPALLLDAHLDTVSADSWREGDPYVPRLAGGRLYGRGSCDTKASMADFMERVALYAAHPSRAPGSPRLPSLHRVEILRRTTREVLGYTCGHRFTQKSRP